MSTTPMSQPSQPSQPAKSRRTMYAVLGVVIIVIIIVAGLWVGGYFPGTGTPAANASAKAYDTGTCTGVSNCDFTPATLSISTNTKVTWTSNSTQAHTVAACSTTNNPSSTECPNMNASGLPSFDLGSSGYSSGQSVSYTFTTAGTYYYYCRIHSWMHAQVNVS